MLERGIHDFPQYIDLHLAFSAALTQLDQRDKARKHWQKIVELNPDNTIVQTAYAFALANNMGTVSETNEQIENAFRLDLPNNLKIELNELSIDINTPPPPPENNMKDDWGWYI